MIIRSVSHETPEEEFEMEVVGECEDMGEPAYLCVLLPKYKESFQEGDKPIKIRKSLIAGENLYIRRMSCYEDETEELE